MPSIGSCRRIRSRRTKRDQEGEAIVKAIRPWRAARRLPLARRAVDGLYHSVRISPDGTSAVVGDRDSARGLWIWDVKRELRTPLSVGPAGGDGPIWSTDGTRVAYDDNVGGIGWILANDAAPPERLPEPPHPEPDPYFFSPDGTALV